MCKKYIERLFFFFFLFVPLGKEYSYVWPQTLAG